MERTQCCSALCTVELDVLELGKDATTASNNSTDTDQTIQVRLTKLAQRVLNGYICDSDMDLVVNALVVGVVEKYDFHGDLVEDLEHLCGCVRKPVRECRLRLGQVIE